VSDRRVRLSIKTSPQGVDWTTLDETWAAIGEQAVFDGIWLNDHLVQGDGHSGPSLEALTLAATLAHRVPGKSIGHGVLSNTFRHPAILAKAATVLDHATKGRFIIGLGAGWHEGEHEAFGIALPPIKERVDRLESAVAVIRALFSPEALAAPGVTRDDPFYPLQSATNEPGPFRAGGPPLYLGGQRRRGLDLAARAADGWLLPGAVAGDVAYFTDKRDAMLERLEAHGRDRGAFTFVGQVQVGDDRNAAVDGARDLVASGADEVVLGMRPRLGPPEVRAIVEEVANPLRDAFG
jgi:alkanesulfonate monooxygenase SsuD/methylene tetrahydromethanopterin reductase-like flavin-dependent oxidoreductase (luciferase family)